MLISRPNISSTSVTDFPVADRFIKLPIENFMGNELEQEPVPPQIALINAINDPRFRFVVAALSRRTGKTHISNVIGFLLCMVPGTNILIMSPNYSLSSISWDLQRGFLAQFELEVVRSNAKDRIMELSNGSTVRMGSVTQADSVVGRSYDLIIFDEAALNDKGGDAFMIQLLPTLDKVGAKAIFISTPRHRNWFYDYYMNGFSDDPTMAEWVSILATYRDNPRVDMAVVKTARATMSKAEFAQEYECSFVALQGQIWDLPDSSVVEVDLTKVSVIDYIAGLDIGFRDPTALVVLATDGYFFYIIKEYQDNIKTTADQAEAIHELVDCPSAEVDFIYIDSAAAQTAYDLANTYDIGTIKAKKSVLDGIGYVSSIIENGRLFVDASCKEMIWSIDNYRWDTREGKRKEGPEEIGDSKKASHLCDALRYAMYTYSYNMEGLMDPEEVVEAPEFKLVDKLEILA